jgi:hypothetical protein
VRDLGRRRRPLHHDGRRHGWADDEVAWGTKFLRITGDESFDGDDVEEVVEGWPFTPGENTFYGYGTYSVDRRIYTWLWKSEGERWYSRPIANRLLYTDDLGKSFLSWDGPLRAQQLLVPVEPGENQPGGLAGALRRFRRACRVLTRWRGAAAS